MSEWECGVCGYIHKEDDPPEKCPVCEAPKKMFISKSGDAVTADNETIEEAVPEESKKTAEAGWECGVCGYIHKEENPPEKCPVCEAPEKMFIQKGGEEAAADQPPPETEEPAESKENTDEGLECGVCGYIHKEDSPPEKCPICEAPQKMFVDLRTGAAPRLAEVKAEDTDTGNDGDTSQEKQWRCSVSGYLHTGPEPPAKCPVCEATAEQFEEVTGEEVVKEEEPQPVATDSDRRWRCTVCGYIHEGDAPPDKCPMCGAAANMFVEIDANGNSLEGEEEVSGVIPGDSAGVEAAPPTFFDKISKLVLRFHLHPIHTHFPNGILPVVLIFLGIGIYFNIASLEAAAFYNAIGVLAVLPVVIFTGYVEWQKRYKGIKTAVFIIKIICSVIVLGAVATLVFWRIIDPQVAAAGSPYQLIYLGVAGLALAGAGIAGHLGGNLVFAARH